MSAAARITTANAPIAIPTIGPVPKPGFEATAAAPAVAEDEVDAVGVEVAPVAVVVRVGDASTGKYSRGLNSIVAFSALANCAANVKVAF
jgi:hypothetical protein